MRKKLYYIIAYDLDRAAEEYKNLHEKLESWGAQRIQDSVWIAHREVEDSSEIVRELYAEGLMRRSDRLLVALLDDDDRFGWNLLSSLPNPQTL